MEIKITSRTTFYSLLQLLLLLLYVQLNTIVEIEHFKVDVNHD